jgi:peroxiredoxin Q/BCP
MPVKKATPPKRTAASKAKTASAKTKSAKDDMHGITLREGQAAPKFKLPDDEGNMVSLSDFKGKKVVLYFYPKDDTSGCTAEACSFRDGSAAIKKKGAVILGVSPDPVKSHGKFRDKYELNFRLLSDEEKKVLTAYGVWQEKSMYGRKYFGVVRTTFIIDEKGKIARIFPKVKVTGHFEEVLAAL